MDGGMTRLYGHTAPGGAVGLRLEPPTSPAARGLEERIRSLRPGRRVRPRRRNGPRWRLHDAIADGADLLLQPCTSGLDGVRDAGGCGRGRARRLAEDARNATRLAEPDQRRVSVDRASVHPARCRTPVHSFAYAVCMQWGRRIGAGQQKTPTPGEGNRG